MSTPQQLALQPDEVIAKAAQRGSLQAFEQLVRRYQLPLLRFLTRRSARGAETPEDIVQDTFIRVYQSLNQYQPSRPFKPWLFTIAWRTCQNANRRRRPVQCDATVEEWAPTETSPVDALAQREANDNLWRFARTALGEQAFAAICLFYIEAMPIKDIAGVLGLTPEATKVTLHRARKTLLVRLPKDIFAPVSTGETT
ncbi:MAG: sigma-70 family RNA polymerase sigma factor [Phycisphaerales bacterium]|nr:sigma-70 family RNA polymerase sigma factor [Phycisphaerales bacterium]